MIVNICSSGSSGSTLFAFLLNNHPEIVCGAELSLFTKPVLYNNYDYFKKNLSLIEKYGISSYPYSRSRNLIRNYELYGLSHEQVWSFIREANNIKELAARFYQHISNNTGKKIWAEKTPLNIRLISSFIKAFPKAKIIHIVRDPRDVVLSLMKRKQPVPWAANVWLASVACIQNYRSLENVLEIKYEDLILDTEVTLMKISDFLQVDFRMAYFTDNKFASKNIKLTNGFESWGLQPSEGISSKSIGKYKNSPVDLAALSTLKLTEEYARIINTKQFSLSELAGKYGYSIKNISNSIHKGIRVNDNKPIRADNKPVSAENKRIFSSIDIDEYIDKTLY